MCFVGSISVFFNFKQIEIMAKEMKGLLIHYGLTKDIGDKHYWITKSWDLASGYGWHIQVYSKSGNRGCGFHKTNRFTAIKTALRSLASGGDFPIADY